MLTAKDGTFEKRKLPYCESVTLQTADQGSAGKLTRETSLHNSKYEKSRREKFLTPRHSAITKADKLYEGKLRFLYQRISLNVEYRRQCHSPNANNFFLLK